MKSLFKRKNKDKKEEPDNEKEPEKEQEPVKPILEIPKPDVTLNLDLEAEVGLN